MQRQLVVVVVAVVLVADGCLVGVRRHKKRVILFRRKPVPPRPQEPPKSNCLIDICYLSLDHPKLCQTTLKTLKSRDAIEGCSDTCAANATGPECQHAIINLYLLNRYNGLSCGKQWESTLWGVKSNRTHIVSSTTSTHQSIQSTRYDETTSKGTASTLVISENPNDKIPVRSKSYQSSVSELSSRAKQVFPKMRDYRLAMKKALWLLLYRHWLLSQQGRGISNLRRLLKQSSKSDNVQTPSKSSGSSLVLGDHVVPLKMVSMKSAGDPTASNQHPLLRDSNKNISEVLPVKTDRAYRLQFGKDSINKALERMLHSRLFVIAKGRMGLRRENAVIAGKERLQGNKGRMQPRNDSLNSDIVLEPKTKIHARKDDWKARQQKQGEEGKNEYNTNNVSIKNIQSSTHEGSGCGWLLWVTLSLLCVVLAVLICSGCLVLAYIIKNRGKKRSYDLKMNHIERPKLIRLI